MQAISLLTRIYGSRNPKLSDVSAALEELRVLRDESCLDVPIGFLPTDEPMWERLPGSGWSLPPELRSHMATVLGRLRKYDWRSEKILQSVDLGINVGTASVVPTTSDDDVRFMLPVNADGSPAWRGFRRVVFGRDREPTTKVAVSAERMPPTGAWVLKNVTFGDLVPPEPWEVTSINKDDLWKKSFEFWLSHATVYDPSVFRDQTLVTTDPGLVGYFQRRNEGKAWLKEERRRYEEEDLRRR